MAIALLLVGLMALFALASVHGAPAASGLSCLDMAGKPVDWWVVYKMPTVSGNPLSNNGYGFAYADAKNPLKIQEGQTLQDEKNALGHTLNQIYEGPKTVGHIMWNDQSPAGKMTSSMAHAKGVMGFDLKQGFLLRHSLPRYANMRKDGYDGVTAEERIYGQTFLCASVDLPTLNKIAGQYLIAHPMVFDSSVPATSDCANLTAMAKGVIAKASMGVLEFKTTGGTVMTDLVKSNKCACDFWDTVVAPYYKQSMSTLTWGRPQQAPGCALKSSAAPGKALNVQNINAINWPGGLNYLETNEHSKWGITADKNVACIGDINRMTSQRKRGGGATCFQNPKLAAALSGLVKGVDPC